MGHAHTRLAALADDLERTMRDLGAWSEPAPPLVPFTQPFAMDAMPFEHWLQLVLVPRMRAIAAAGERLPMRSNLAPHAVREFDGRDEEMTSVVDVLRAIDDLCPAPVAPAPDSRRRTIARLLLIVPMFVWAVVAIQIGRWGARIVTNLFPARIVQTWTGTIAPGTDFQPLRITMIAEVDPAGTLRPRDAHFLVLRSRTTLLRGPTAPLRFRAPAPPTTSDVVAWLATFGVAPGTTADAAANEAIAVVQAAAAAPTRDALRTLATDRPTTPRADPLIELTPQAPAWVEIAVTILALLAGAVPITIAVVRYARKV